MQSKFTKKLFSSLLYLSVCTTVIAQAKKEPEGLYIFPYLQYATPTSIIIKWETLLPVIGTVVYSEDQSFGQRKSETSPVKIHEIKLEGLKPATRYHYKVSFENSILEEATFTTAPVPGTPHWRMVAYGDNRTYPETHKRVVDQILKLNPSMVIHSGDLVTDGSSYEQWKVQYFDPMRGLSENITVFPSLGNHERNSPHYYEYMSLPEENGESFYSFDYGNAHFIALNSNAGEAPFDIDSEQTKWLIKDLKEHADATWKIVYFHHPLFRCHPSRGIEPQRWVWQEVFEENGVDLVVNGHDHYYQRTYAIGNYQGKPGRGIYHLISGGGGANNYPIVPKVHAASRRSVHHITVMDFQDDRIVGRAIDDQGNVIDAFIYDKKAENSPEEFISYEVFKIERDLADAIYNIETTYFEGDIRVENTLTIENPFKHPLKMTFSWEPSKNWETNTPKTEILQPGNSLNISYTVSAGSDAIHSMPSAKLYFQTPDGEIPFKNNTIVFNPLKIGTRKQVKPGIVKNIPVIDGMTTEAEWGKSLLLTQFSDVQGTLPLQKTEIRVSTNKAKSSLYIMGKMEASQAISASGVTERDNQYIVRSENVKIHLAVGKETYTYIVNPKGALLDTKDITTYGVAGAVSWNSTATAAAKPHENGWQFELEIPLEELNIGGQKTTINFSRRDAERNSEYEYVRTFGRSGLDHQIPIYQADWNAVDMFAELILK